MQADTVNIFDTPETTEYDTEIANDILTLIAIAMPLLATINAINKTSAHEINHEFQISILQAVHLFEKQLQAANYSERTISAARYSLCAAIDEAIMNSPWGINSNWSQRTLLAITHKETWGGEKFFIIIDKLLIEKDKDLELLELFLVILNLGFEGQYYNDKTQLEKIKNKLFNTITSKRELVELPFSSYPVSNATKAKRVDNLSYWMLFALTTLICILINGLLEIYLKQLSNWDLSNITAITTYVLG